jgi:nucleoside-diphosphate-sugar epimerase
MKIMILGGSGFIGSHLINYLISIRHHIINVNRQIDVLKQDILYTYIKEQKPDVVINCLSFGGKENFTSDSISYAANNLELFTNILRSSKYFKKFINIASGSEIIDSNYAKENWVWKDCPVNSSYAMSKNIIARICESIDHFYTLRLFGCFGLGEPSFRIFSKYRNSIRNNTKLELRDKYFDNFFVEDFCTVVDHIIRYNPMIKDINCVYKDKLTISNQLDLMNSIHSWESNYEVTEFEKNYTGNSDNLDNLNLELKGLEYGLRTYK